MKQADIQSAATVFLAAKGYSEAHWAWPERGRLHVLARGKRLVVKLPAPMSLGRVVARLNRLPRVGPSRYKPAPELQQQASFDAMWSGAAPQNARQGAGNGGRARKARAGGTIGRGKAGARPDAS